MLPQINRLPSSNLRQVMRNGKRVSSNFLDLIILQSKEQNSRFAFVVPVHIDRRATARNRVKRLLRESIQTFLPKIYRNIDAIFIAKSKQLVVQEQRIAQSVSELLQRAGFFERGKEIVSSILFS